MPNLHRGEIDAHLDGRPHRLCLTLGALAELESTFGDEDMLALAERFGRGRLSARDATRLIGAGLRGGGHPIADDAVACMQAEGGASGFVDIVSRLLGATFGSSPAPKTTASVPPAGNSMPGAMTTAPAREERRSPDPFPGAR